RDKQFIPIFKKIFDVMISKNIALEVNYSPLRSPLNSIIPEPKHLKLYLEMGGKLLTIGSDAHSLKAFDDYYEATISHLKNIGFTNISIRRNNKWERRDI
ncbi:MAG: hypothetical protein U9N34_06135, partial [Candidatus Cloacimonadota bacterium]|nr:hypothetical protein [Candidatus Cloacimonadota bacterium]